MEWLSSHIENTNIANKCKKRAGANIWEIKTLVLNLASSFGLGLQSWLSINKMSSLSVFFSGRILFGGFSLTRVIFYPLFRIWLLYTSRCGHRTEQVRIVPLSFPVTCYPLSIPIIVPRSTVLCLYLFEVELWNRYNKIFKEKRARAWERERNPL